MFGIPRGDARATDDVRGRRGLSLRTRLIGAFAAVSSLTLGASVVAFVSYNRIQSGFERIERVGIPAMSRALTLARQASDFSGTIATLPNANDQSELQAGVVRSRQALSSMDRSLAEIAASTGDGVTEHLTADFRGLGADADVLAKSVETRMGLAKRRVQMVAEAEAAHRQLAKVIAPLVDSAEFDLQVGLQSALDDKAAQQLQDRVSSVQALEQLMAESNLIVGMLVEASLADQVELLTPFRDRLTASEDKAERAAAALSKDADAGEARTALHALIAFGQEDQDIFQLRRRELEEFAAERKIMADSRDKSVALAAHVEELVAGARDVSKAAIATSQRSIELSRYWLVGLTICGLALALISAGCRSGVVCCRRLALFTKRSHNWRTATWTRRFRRKSWPSATSWATWRAPCKYSRKAPLNAFASKGRRARRVRRRKANAKAPLRNALPPPRNRAMSCDGSATPCGGWPQAI